MIPDNERTCLLGEDLDTVDRLIFYVRCKRNPQLALAKNDIAVANNALTIKAKTYGLLTDRHVESQEESPLSQQRRAEIKEKLSKLKLIKETE